MAETPSTVLPAPDWSALVAEHGEPLLLEEFQELCGDDEDAAVEALDIIVDSTIHQYTRYQCSPPSVPFLIAILRTPGAAAEYRTAVAQILTGIAIGSDQGLIPTGGMPERIAAVLAGIPEEARGVDENSFVLRNIARREGYDEGAANAEQAVVYGIRRYWGVASYYAVRDAVGDVLPILADPDASVRAHAAMLLGWFPERADVVLPALSACAAAPDTTPLTRAVAGIAYAMCAERPRDGDGGDIAWLHADLASGDEVPSWGAAVALARLYGNDAPPEVSARLLDFLTAEEHHDDLRRLPTVSTIAPSITANALAATGPLTGERIDALCTAFVRLGTDDAYDMIGPLLHAAFGEPLPRPRPPFAELTAVQRRLVQACAVADRAWHLGNFHDDLGEYGLPDDREELAAYAGLDRWASHALRATAAIPGAEPAQITVSGMPQALHDEVKALMWAVVEADYDEPHLDAYVDEDSYRTAARVWFDATEARLRAAYPAMDVDVVRDDLAVDVRIHPFASVRRLELETTSEAVWEE